MNSKSRLWQFLSAKGSATNAEIAEFMRGTVGQLSWGRRLRDLRKEMQAKGGDIICRELRKGIYLYKVVWPEAPDTSQESTVRENNRIQEEAINFKAVNKQLVFI